MGGLFDDYEETGEVFAAIGNGQSKTKKAQYFRQYRQDPEKNDRINSQRRRNRKMKKESEMNGNVRSIFESEAAALPAKAEQQANDTRESPVQMNLAQKEQTTQREDLLESKAQLHLKTRKPFSLWLASLTILSFLGFNTYFLVAEQFSLYQSLGYGFSMASLIAVLTELSMILLSLLANWTKDFVWKLALFAGCACIVYTVVGVLDSSAQHRSAAKLAESEMSMRLKKEITSLEAKEATALAIIGNLNLNTHPTKISRLMSELEGSGPKGYSYWLKSARKRLDKITAVSVSNHEVEVLKQQRRVALLVNLLLSGFLGFLWSQKRKKKYLDGLSEMIRNYWSRPCEVSV